MVTLFLCHTETPIILKRFHRDHRKNIDFARNYSMPLSPDVYQQVEAALRSGDVAALHALSEDYAPFYCTRCPGVFCPFHYQLVEVWDEYGLDYWYGACPYGHKKFIDH